MIIYGWKSVLGKVANTVGLTCPSCQKDQLTVGTRHSYFHVYWIPFFPYRRERVAVCNHCKKIMDEKELSATANLTGSLERLPQKEGFRPHHFAFIILIFVLGTFGAFADQKRSNRPSARSAGSQLPGGTFENGQFKEVSSALGR